MTYVYYVCTYLEDVVEWCMKLRLLEDSPTLCSRGKVQRKPLASRDAMSFLPSTREPADTPHDMCTRTVQGMEEVGGKTNTHCTRRCIHTCTYVRTFVHTNSLSQTSAFRIIIAFLLCILHTVATQNLNL